MLSNQLLKEYMWSELSVKKNDVPFLLTLFYDFRIVR